MGSFQSLAAGGFSQTVSLYVLGVLTAVGGALGGRVVCGWLCPFGLFQDILYGLKQENGSYRGRLNMLSLLCWADSDFAVCVAQCGGDSGAVFL